MISRNRFTLGLAVLVLAIGTLGFQSGALAERMIIPRPVCDLKVFPFDESKPTKYETDLDPWLYQASKAICNIHLTFPTSTPYTSEAYNPQPVTDSSEIPLKAGAKDYNGPTAKHSHNYYNDSLQDSFYYESYVGQFAIDLAADDTQKNTTGTVYCDTPYPDPAPEGIPSHDNVITALGGCDGYIAGLWGGTKVEKIYNGGKISSVVWTFGQDHGKAWDAPRIFGQNPSLDLLIGKDFDSTNENNRTLGANINLTTFNVSSPTHIWSSSTTARILVRDFSILKTSNMTKLSSFCSVPGNYDKWCSLPTPTPPGNSYQAGSGNFSKYYWFPIGTTSAVWRKAPPPPPLTTCESLSWSITQNGAVVDPSNVVTDTPMTINVTPTFTPAGKTVPLKYTWNAGTGFWLFFTNQGQFKDNTASDADVGNPFTDNLNDTIAYYTGGPKDTVVSVDALYGNGDSTQCHQEFKITKPSTRPKLECSGIDLTPSTILGPDKDNNYSATVHLQDPTKPVVPLTYPTNVSWSGVNGAMKPVSTPLTNAAPFTSKFHTNPGVPGASVHFKVTGITAPGFEVNLSNCKKDLNFTFTPDSNKCETLGLSGVPSSVGAYASVPLKPNPKNISSPPGDPTSIIWSEYGDGFLQITSPALIPLGCQNKIDEQKITLPKLCTYNYVTPATGDGSATVTVVPNTSNPDVSNCHQTINFHAATSVKPYCVSVDLQPDHLNSLSSTSLDAKVNFSDGKSYNTTLQWAETNGSFSDDLTKTQNSSIHFANTFTKDSNDNEASVTASVINILDPKVDNSKECQDGMKIKTPPKKDTCGYFRLTEKADHSVCVDTDYKGLIQWTIGDSTSTDNQICKYPPPNTYVKAFGTREKNCWTELTTSKQPPKLTKGVRLDGSSSAYKKVMSITSNQTDLQYQLIFEADPSSKTSATITDDISFGPIDGKTFPTDMGKGRIEYVNDSMSVKESGSDLKGCTAAIKENCYTGDIGTPGGVQLVKVTGPISITYRGTVTESAITPDVCKNGIICQEKYLNSANASYNIFNPGGVTLSGSISSNQTVVQLFCQYILARAAGDIYLEKDLQSGIDIRRCSKYTNITGLVIKPAPPTTQEVVSTGLPSSIFSINHEICNAGQAGTLPDVLKPFYGQDVVANLSSSICEVSLQTGKEWQKSTLVNNVNENKTRISRWEPTVPEGTGAEINTLDPDLSVYRVKKGNLTVDQAYTLSDGDGAKTFIVEDGDLIINNDIKYGTCNKTPPDICTVRDTASLAFIVLNGNVYVDPSVTEMSGVYFVQAGENGNNGQLFSGAPGNPGTSDHQDSNKKLEVFGSVYGDINPLFSNRTFSGDPAQEGGGIVIRFDERIILNTPPGLRDVLSLSQTEVAR